MDMNLFSRFGKRMKPCLYGIHFGLGILAIGACSGCRMVGVEVGRQQERGSDWAAEARQEMVTRQIAARGVTDRLVLQAMGRVPRHRFVPPEYSEEAYSDRPLPIGHAQTISQPYIVAFMTEALGLHGGEHVLEIGTGSGYQAAVLAEIAGEVYTIEIVAPLAEHASRLLEELGFKNVKVRTGDGYRGWPEQAPFDRIIVTAAPTHVPQPLVDQLRVGGRLIIPVGAVFQRLLVLEKTKKGIKRRFLLPVRFVPMTGEAQRRKP